MAISTRFAYWSESKLIPKCRLELISEDEQISSYLIDRSKCESWCGMQLWEKIVPINMLPNPTYGDRSNEIPGQTDYRWCTQECMDMKLPPIETRKEKI